MPSVNNRMVPQEIEPEPNYPLSSRMSDTYLTSKLLPDVEPLTRRDEIISGSLDKPVGLNIDDFIPVSFPSF